MLNNRSMTLVVNGNMTAQLTTADSRSKNCMSEIFDSSIESSKEVSAWGAQAKKNLLAQIKQEPTKTFSIILAGSVLVTVLLGYFISRAENQSKQRRLVEDTLREVADWMREHGRSIAGPLKEGFDATKSAVEDVARSSARVGRQWQPFLEKQKRSFLNLF